MEAARDGVVPGQGLGRIRGRDDPETGSSGYHGGPDNSSGTIGMGQER